MKKILIVSLIIALIIGVNSSLIFAQHSETIKTSDLQFTLSTKHLPRLTKLATSLEKLYNYYTEKKNFQELANRENIKLIDEKVVVTILPQIGLTTEVIDFQILENLGVIIKASAKHSMRVAIPIKNLEKAATKVKGIGEIRRLIKPKAAAIISEGIALMKADLWHGAGYQGINVKVAVIDLGFEKLTLAQLNGDIPASYESHDFSNTGLQTGTAHGTAVAEAVYDVAPQAQLYLYKISDLTDFENAMTAAKNNSVNIINHSLGWFNAGGYYDGTGRVCDIANNAITNGIIWVNSAGNNANIHYRATFTTDAYV